MRGIVHSHSLSLFYPALLPEASQLPLKEAPQGRVVKIAEAVTEIAKNRIEGPQREASGI